MRSYRLQYLSDQAGSSWTQKRSSSFGSLDAARDAAIGWRSMQLRAGRDWHFRVIDVSVSNDFVLFSTEHDT